MYKLLNDGAVTKSHKELAMNIITFFNDFFVICASLTALLLNNSMLNYTWRVNISYEVSYMLLFERSTIYGILRP